MCFEGRSMQKQARIYQISKRKLSENHTQFQGRFLLDVEIILEPIWVPFGSILGPLLLHFGLIWDQCLMILTTFWKI